MTHREHSPVLVRAMLELERTESLDRAADAAQPMADALVAGPARRRVLHGRVLGHALHPLLTDVPIGTWVSALVLDLSGGAGAQPAAQRLVGAGVLAAVPTAVSGWAEWARTEGGVRRVGVVHAAANTVGLGLYTGSWLARRGGRHGLGIGLSLVASLGVAVGGQLGAHMTLARKVATHDEAFDDGGAPAAQPADAQPPSGPAAVAGEVAAPDA